MATDALPALDSLQISRQGPDEFSPAAAAAGLCSSASVIDSGAWPRWRYVEATEDLAPGAIVCNADAHVVAVCEEWKRRACASCFAVAEARLERCCGQCQQVTYCSEACQEEHRRAHARVCPALQRWAQMKKAGKETMAVLRLLLEALALEQTGVHEQHAMAASFSALQHHPAVYDTPKEASEWARCCTSFRGVVEACEWCPWRRLASSITSGSGPATASAEGEVRDRDSDEASRAVDVTDGEDGGGARDERNGAKRLPAAPPSDEALHALASRIDSNCFGIFRDGKGDGAPRRASNGRNVDLLGRGVYLEACMFNHSCEPNCSVTSGVGAPTPRAPRRDARKRCTPERGKHTLAHLF